VTVTVAIPLVNPQLELLPVHFVTDPGRDVDWQRADDCTDFHLPLDEKLRLIEQYMDVKVCTMPGVENVKRMEAFDRLTHRRHGSLDSAQVNAMVGKHDEERKHGLIHGAMVRKFGSLGKSVSQKLKSITAGSKTNKFSVGTATQSSRRSTLAVQMLSKHHQVV